MAKWYQLVQYATRFLNRKPESFAVFIIIIITISSSFSSSFRGLHKAEKHLKWPHSEDHSDHDCLQSRCSHRR